MNIIFLGAGNMAEAIVNGILKTGTFNKSEITVTDLNPERIRYFTRKYKVTAVSDNLSTLKNQSIVVLSVKPQQITELLHEIRPEINTKQLVISIAAGVPIKVIERNLPAGTPVIRVMPNTPALVSSGITVLSRGKYANSRHTQTADRIFRAVGKIVHLPEKYLNAVTAISGSGPAYYFYLTEQIENAACEIGLPAKIIPELVTATFYGAASLQNKTGISAEELRHRVTSPGGTTEAAVNYLQNNRSDEIIKSAIKKAYHRAREISATSSK